MKVWWTRMNNVQKLEYFTDATKLFHLLVISGTLRLDKDKTVLLEWFPFLRFKLQFNDLSFTEDWKNYAKHTIHSKE